MIAGPFPVELENLVADELSSGIYASKHDVLLAAVKLLRQKRLDYEQLKQDVQHAIAQADNGEFVEFDQIGLRQFFDDLKAKAVRAGAVSVDD